MIDELIPGFWLVALVLAFLPGLSHWWGSQPLQRALDDPLLSERVFALHRRSAAGTIGALVILVATARSTLFWSIPLLVLVRMLSAYPLRRALYEETWTVPQYVFYTTRTFCGLAGFWLVMAALPALASLAGRFDWLVAFAIGALLLVWNSFYSSAVVWLFNAQPLRDDTLLARLVPMAKQCGLDTVRFAIADLRGGAMVNALALASLRMRAVLFTDGLIARLTADETVAIGGHEIAHLEYYNTDRLRRGRLLIWTLVAIGCVLATISRVTGTPLLLIEAGWVLVLVGFLATLAHHRQKNETDSDRRAVELTGDAEALARALTKAYAFNKYPRRLASQVERGATHPSLARRLRDIRSAAASNPAVLSETVAFTANDGTRLRLEPERLVWEETAGGTHAFPYAKLTELRLDAERRGMTRLVVVDTTARKWTFDLADGDLRAVQTALDTVDGLLAQSQPHVDRWSVLAQIAASVATIAAIAAGAIAASFIAVAAAVRGGRIWFAAAGAASLAGVLVATREEFPHSAWAVIVLVPTATALLAFALKVEAKPLAPTDNTILAAVAAATLLGLAVIASDGLDPVSWFLISRSAGWTIVLTWALAAALTFLPAGRLRRLAPLAGAIAVAVAMCGTRWFVTTFASDGLLVEGQPFTVTNLDAVPTREFTSPLQVTELRLSPGGHSVALAVYDIDPAGEATGLAFHVGTGTEPMVRVHGHDLAFFDDRTFLVMRSAVGKVALATHSVDSAEPTQRVELENLYPGRLVVDIVNRRWTVFGTDDKNRIVRVQGSADARELTRHEWTARRHASYPIVIATSGEDVVVVESEYDFGSLANNPLAAFATVRLMFRAANGVRWWRAGQQEPTELGRSKLAAECVGDTYDERAIHCVAFDGTSTHFSSIDPATGMASPAGLFPGQIIGSQAAAHGWLTGYTSTRVLIADPARARVFGFDRARWPAQPTNVATSREAVAAVWSTDSGSTVRLFPLASTGRPH